MIRTSDSWKSPVSRWKRERRTPELTGMQPYRRYMEAMVAVKDIVAAVREIADLPLEKRYVWRVASALKWGFADFESWNVMADVT